MSKYSGLTKHDLMEEWYYKCQCIYTLKDEITDYKEELDFSYSVLGECVADREELEMVLNKMVKRKD